MREELEIFIEERSNACLGRVKKSSRSLLDPKVIKKTFAQTLVDHPVFISSLIIMNFVFISDESNKIIVCANVTHNPIELSELIHNCNPFPSCI